MRVDLFRGVPAGSAAGGGSTAPSSVETSVGSDVAFNNELYLGPGGTFSYSAIYWTALPFESTLTRLWLVCGVQTVNLTVRVRANGTQVYSGTLTAGETELDTLVDIVLASGARPTISVAPASGAPNLGAWSTGWVRRLP